MSRNTTVTVADILELRADGLSEEEVWSLLCQAVQTLQDLFLSEEIGRGSAVPCLTPQNLEISNKGRVIISRLNNVHDNYRQYLPPEYGDDAGETSSDIDWEKMWVYSLGKTLQSSLRHRDCARHSSLEVVLCFMTKENPSNRASLMSLLNVISEHCKTNLPSKPFSHLVMDMYREVFGTPPQCLSPPGSLKLSPVSWENGSSPLTSMPFPRVILSDSETNTCPGRSPAKGPAARNPVQRAPSRLYRGPTKLDESIAVGSATSNACVGPEFVVRGAESPRVVHAGVLKAQQRTVTVVLLTGVRVQVVCDPSTITSGKVFEILAQLEQLEDNFIFGLACLMNGDFIFVPPEMKLHKLAPCGWKDAKNGRRSPSRIRNFLLYMRVKFFLPNLRGIRNWTTKHLLYLQLRRSLIEQQIKCELKELLSLGGLALQAEFGNFDEQEHGSSAYFLLEHYLPEELIDERLELERQLQELHKSRSGLDPGRAEEIFVAQAQRLPEYGSHHYTALWVRKTATIPMWVTVNPQGVYLYEKKKNVLDRKIHEAFIWKNIQSLKWNEQYFYIVPHNVGKQKLTRYKLRMDNKKSFFFFRLASFHHQFFLKLRVELSSLHSLTLEFGIPIRKTENEENLKNRTQEWMRRREMYQERRMAAAAKTDEGYQNKENENPMENRKEKRKGVKMGVRAFSATQRDGSEAARRFSVSTEASNSSSDAYVLDASIRTLAEKFSYDLQETIPSALADKFNSVAWEGERILRRITLAKDKYGSFGLEVVEGENGGIFVENVLKAKGEDDIESMQKGDQLIAVNGICLLSMSYRDALNLLKNSGDRLEVLLSQDCRREARQKPIEMEYLKNIRYDTALEIENYGSDIVVTNVPMLQRKKKSENFPADTALIPENAGTETGSIGMIPPGDASASEQRKVRAAGFLSVAAVAVAQSAGVSGGCAARMRVAMASCRSRIPVSGESSSRRIAEGPQIKLSLRRPKNWRVLLTVSSSSAAVAVPEVTLRDERGRVLIDTSAGRESRAAARTNIPLPTGRRSGEKREPRRSKPSGVGAHQGTRIPRLAEGRKARKASEHLPQPKKDQPEEFIFARETSEISHLRGSSSRKCKNDPAAGSRRSKRRLVNSKDSGMGSNISRHSGKGLSGRRTQSSGNLCNGAKILAPSFGRILNSCGVRGVSTRDRNKFCGSLPNHLDDKDVRSGECTPESLYSVNNNYGDIYIHPARGKNVELLFHKIAPPPQQQQHQQHQQDFSGGDQGYGSERSPEEELPPPLPTATSQQCATLRRNKELPFLTKENTFEARLEKGSRGLGLSVTGGIETAEKYPGLIRIKRIFPHQPAWESKVLQVGDIILAVNGVPLTDLTNYEALEVLRTTPNDVMLKVCRPPGDVFSLPPPCSGEPPPPPRRDPGHVISSSRAGTSNVPPPPQVSTEPHEFEIVLRKVNGSLGFMLRKEDESVLGHCVRALVREPALSDGRIRPGDKIVTVNGVEISPMSHEEAVIYLRQCGEEVRLRLYRDPAQTPVSALSPTESYKTFRPKPALRKEAVDMLCDLAVKKLIPSESSSSSGRSKLRGSSPGSSPRRRKLNKAPTESEDGDDRPQRPNFLDLRGTGTGTLGRNQTAQEEDADSVLDGTGSSEAVRGAVGDAFPAEPSSMPPITVPGSGFSYKNPAYQSAHPAIHPVSDESAGDQDIQKNKVFNDGGGSQGLLKWKGVLFTPEDGVENVSRKTERWQSDEEVLTVELCRGWNSRLGFSLRSSGTGTCISAIYSDSVAAKDGRLQPGDHLAMINDESTEEMSTSEVIDLLRKIRGTVAITVRRKQREKS